MHDHVIVSVLCFCFMCLFYVSVYFCRIAVLCSLQVLLYVKDMTSIVVLRTYHFYTFEKRNTNERKDKPAGTVP